MAVVMVVRTMEDAQHRNPQATKKSASGARCGRNIDSAVRPVTRLAAVVLLVAAVAPLWAEDWPQFLGPERNGYHGPALSEAWGSQGPRVVWRKNVGQGFSGPVVAQGRIILFHRVANEEVVEALDPRTGATQWRYAHTTSYRDDFGFDEGPRAVPVIANGISTRSVRKGSCMPSTWPRARACGASIRCDTASRKDSSVRLDHHSSKTAGFSPTSGPECRDRRLRCQDRTADLDRATNDEASYSSAAGATIAGRRVAIFLTRAGLVGLDPASGKVQFQRPWRARMAASVNVATPLVIGDLLFVSAEHGPGAGVFRLDGTTLNQLWASDEVLTNHYATSVHYEGTLYGFHGRQEFGQSFRAVELRTGKGAGIRIDFWRER